MAKYIFHSKTEIKIIWNDISTMKFNTHNYKCMEEEGKF